MHSSTDLWLRMQYEQLISYEIHPAICTFDGPTFLEPPSIIQVSHHFNQIHHSLFICQCLVRYFY